MNNLQITMQSIADQMQFITQHLTADQNTVPKDSTFHSPVKKKQRQQAMLPDEANNQIQIMRSVTTEFELSNEAQNTNADQEEAQYTTPRSPGTAMEE